MLIGISGISFPLILTERWNDWLQFCQCYEKHSPKAFICLSVHRLWFFPPTAHWEDHFQGVYPVLGSILTHLYIDYHIVCICNVRTQLENKIISSDSLFYKFIPSLFTYTYCHEIICFSNMLFKHQSIDLLMLVYSYPVWIFVAIFIFHS